MPTRPLTNVIGATENILRRLLREEVLSHTAIEGYDEWVYLNIQDAATDSARVEELVADALQQPRAAATAARARLIEAGVLDSAGALTGSGREQLIDCRQLLTQARDALTAGIDRAALQTTLETLETVGDRAKGLLNH
jgi:hypothetical protein